MRRFGVLTVAVGQRLPGASVQESADAITAEQGFETLGSGWRQMDEAEAREYLVKVLHRTLAYGGEIMSTDKAEYLAAQWMSLTSAPRSFLTNWTWHPDGSAWSSPLTSSTLDLAVVAVDEREVVLLCVEDED